MEKARSYGADAIEIEYRSGKEEITAFSGIAGVGLGSLTTAEAKPLFKEIDELKKQKQVSIGGVTYKLKFSEHQSFGETVYRIGMKEIRTAGTSG